MQLCLESVDIGCLAASIKQELGAVRPAHTNVGVPHAALALVTAEVPLYHDGCRIRTLDLEEHVADFHGTGLSCGNVPDWLGSGPSEVGSQDGGPALADDLDLRRYRDRVGDKRYTPLLK